MRGLAALLALTLAAPAAAQEVMDCDWQAGAASIAEPWDENTETFANGDVRIALLDTVEPALGWAYLLVLSPPYDELGIRQCRVIGAEENMGFPGLDFRSLAADYRPEVGLIFSVDVAQVDPQTAGTYMVPMQVVLNQATGEIRAGLAD